MYEKYTRQSLPERSYRELLGSALCAFSANNSFIIKNILRSNITDETWCSLIGKESGRIKDLLVQQLSGKDELWQQIATLFGDIVNKRNRIVHSFQITSKDGFQILATKEKKSGKQFHITKEFLYEFIKDNEKLCMLLHKLRGTNFNA